MSTTTPILTDALIDLLLQEQRRQLCPPSGWGVAAWPLRAGAALATLTPDGWCHIGWLERISQIKVSAALRHQVWWHVDTGEVRVERTSPT
ncbi:MAG: hypothetical protein QM692_08110 [Thermomicrobiales bacterium]